MLSIKTSNIRNISYLIFENGLHLNKYGLLSYYLNEIVSTAGKVDFIVNLVESGFITQDQGLDLLSQNE